MMKMHAFVSKCLVILGFNVAIVMTMHIHELGIPLYKKESSIANDSAASPSFSTKGCNVAIVMTMYANLEFLCI